MLRWARFRRCETSCQKEPCFCFHSSLSTKKGEYVASVSNKTEIRAKSALSMRARRGDDSRNLRASPAPDTSAPWARKISGFLSLAPRPPKPEHPSRIWDRVEPYARTPSQPSSRPVVRPASRKSTSFCRERRTIRTHQFDSKECPVAAVEGSGSHHPAFAGIRPRFAPYNISTDKFALAPPD